MTELKFSCPECRQHLAVASSAAGLAIDCPRCCSSLVIPASSGAVPEVVKRRRLVSLAGTSDGAYEVLERKEKELAVALAEAAQLRAEQERSQQELKKLRDSVTAVRPVRERLPIGGAAVVPRPQAGSVGGDSAGELARLRAELKAARDAAELLKRASPKLAEEGAALRERIKAVETERDDLRAQLQTKGEVEAQRQSIQIELEKLRVELDRATAERDLGKAEAERNTADSTKVRAILDAALDRLDLEQNRLRKVTAEFAASERERVELQARLGEPNLAPQLAAVRDELAGVQQELCGTQARQQTLQTERDQACHGRADLEETLRSAFISAEAANAEAQHLRHEAAEAGKEQVRLQTQLDAARGESVEMRKRVDGLLSLLQARERELAQAQESFAAVARERDETQTILAKRCKELAEATARANVLHHEAAAAKLNASRQAASEFGEERVRLLSQLDEARRDVGELQKWVDGLLESTKARQSELVQAQDAISAGERERDISHGILAGQREELATTAALADALRSDLEKLRADHSTVQEERDTLKEQAQKSAERTNSMQQCLLALSDKVKQQTAQWHAAQFALEVTREEREQRGEPGDPAKGGGAGEPATVSGDLEPAAGQITSIDEQLRRAELERQQAKDELRAAEADREGMRSELEALRLRLEGIKQGVPGLPCCRRAAVRWAAEALP